MTDAAGIERRDVWRVYDGAADVYDRLRDRSLFERGWLEQVTGHLAPGAAVLDLGCGTGEPIARFLLKRGLRVTGVDAATAMLALARRRLPQGEWIAADMRGLALGRRFAAVVAWDGFFHLEADDQRAMFDVFAAHAAPAARLLFTSGPAAGEAVGSLEDRPLFHASLDPEEYEALLARAGFRVLAHAPRDAASRGHTVWLAERTV